MSYTFEVDIASEEALIAIITAARAIEDIEFAMHPSRGTPDGSKAAKPGSKPPPGDRRAVGCLRAAIRKLDSIAIMARGLYEPQVSYQERVVAEAREVARILDKARRMGAL